MTSRQRVRPTNGSTVRRRAVPRLIPEAGGIPGARKDSRLITAEGVRPQNLIHGVAVRESINVSKGHGMLTEVFRRDWNTDGRAIDQVFQVWMAPGEISAWHAHRSTLDRLFVSHGHLRIVLFDARKGSKTFGRVNEFQFGGFRPALVVVPPGVWHGVQNVSHEPSLVLNLVDAAYAYDDPDHWRLPLGTRRIPYSFPNLCGS